MAAGRPLRQVERLLPRLRVPLLAILARPRDAAVATQREQDARRLLQLAPGPTRLQWLDGGHDLPVQRPTAVASLVAAFVAGLAAEGDPRGLSRRSAARREVG